MGGTGRRFCFFSNETFVVCRPGLDDSFQLRAENLILLEPLLFFYLRFHTVIEARRYAGADAVCEV